VKKRPYDANEVDRHLREVIAWLDTLDDAGSRDFTFAALQEYFQNMEPILDENGGI
jgi:hypothetical protein